MRHCGEALTVDSNHQPEQRVSAIVQRMFKERPTTQVICPDDKLTEAGLTSLDLVTLVLLVEEEFGIELPIGDITPANFSSITTISQLITRLLDRSLL